MAGVYERGGQWWAVPKPVPLTTVVRGALLNALAYTNGHQGEAAQLLGLSARQMSYQLRLHHVPGSGRGRPRLVARRRRLKMKRLRLARRTA